MDNELLNAVSRVVEQNPDDFADVVDDEDGAKNYLVGLVLQETDGQYDPSEIVEVIDQFVEEAGPQVYLFRYLDAYNFAEKVSELGIPETAQSKDCFYDMPEVMLEMEYDSRKATPTGVRINGTMYNLEER